MIKLLDLKYKPPPDSAGSGIIIDNRFLGNAKELLDLLYKNPRF